MAEQRAGIDVDLIEKREEIAALCAEHRVRDDRSRCLWGGAWQRHS